MVNFKCCPNIFVIFLGKKMDRYIVVFFSLKKIIKLSTWQMPPADWRPHGYRYMWLQLVTCIYYKWHISHVADCGHVYLYPRGRQSAVCI